MTRLPCGMLLAGLLSLCLTFGCSQTDTQAQKAPPQPIIYAGSWGTRGNGPGQLDEPTCIATDTIGNIYIADAASHFVSKFGPDGTPRLSFQEPLLGYPSSIAVDSGGAIYVADSAHGRLSIFRPNGQRYGAVRVRVRQSADDPLSVSVDDEGLISVLDVNAARVFTYTSRLRLHEGWRPIDAAQDEHGRAEAIADSPDGFFYVADPDGNRILRFDFDKHRVSEIQAGANGSGYKLSDKFTVSRNAIFAMDADGHTLHVWSTDGARKLDFDLAPDLGPASRSAPALAISPQGDLAVLDAADWRVLRYHVSF